MFLSAKERNKTMNVIKTLGQSLDSKAMRESSGYALLDLLQSDQFASFVWDEKQTIFKNGVSINMSSNNLSNYSNYFQKHDPITGKLMVRRHATMVNEVISQKALTNTEFYNDFLAKDGLHYGINLFAYENNKNIGDFRIWRRKGRSNFDEKSTYILDLIKPYFCNAMRNIKQHENALSMSPEQNIYIENLDTDMLMLKFSLTKREAQITLEIMQGLKDEGIASKLHIAYSTLRTHIKHIYTKLNVNNRPCLIQRVFKGN